MNSPVGYCRTVMNSTAMRSPRPFASVSIAVLLGLGLVAGLLVPVEGLKAGALIALGLVAIGVAVYAPGVIFALYLMIPFFKGAAQQYSPVDLTLALAVLNTLQIVAIVVHRPAPHVSRTGLALWVLLGMIVLGGVLYAPDQTLALSHAEGFEFLVFVPLLVGALRVGSDPRYVRQLLWMFVAMGILTTVVGLPSISGSDRLVVLGADTIDVASAALLVPLLWPAFVARHGSQRVRLVTIILIPLALIVALASGSRGPVLVLLAMAMLGVIRYLAHPRSVNWPRTAGVTGAVLAVILFVSFASPYLPALSTSRFTLFGDFVQNALTGDPGNASAADTSSAARVALYGVAITMFEERPILGFGTAGFEAMSNYFLGYDEAYPHNALLQFAAEFGLVGAALFVSLVTVGLARRLPELGQPIRIAFLYFLLQAMLSNDILSDRTTWGLLLLLLLMEGASIGRLASVKTEVREEHSALTTDGLAA